MSSKFERVAGWSAVLAAVCGLAYSVSFVVISKSWPDLGAQWSAKFLMLGGLVALPVMVGLYQRYKASEEGMALVALIVGAGGALGSLMHGGYDLANAVHSPGNLPDAVSNLPSPVDPRGLATFCLAGLAVALFSWFMVREGSKWKGLGVTGLVLGVLLVLVYVGRLVILTPSSPLVLAPAALTGFVLSPLWYAWLGWLWLRRR